MTQFASYTTKVDGFTKSDFIRMHRSIENPLICNSDRNCTATFHVIFLCAVQVEMKSSMWNLVIEIERIESNGNIVSVRALVHLRGFAHGNHAESNQLSNYFLFKYHLLYTFQRYVGSVENERKIIY